MYESTNVEGRGDETPPDPKRPMWPAGLSLSGGLVTWLASGNLHLAVAVAAYILLMFRPGEPPHVD